METGGSRANFLLQLARLAEPTFIIKHVTAVMRVRNCNCDVTTMSMSICQHRNNRNMLVDEVLAGGFPRVLFPPLWCFPLRCAGAVPPCSLLTRA